MTETLERLLERERAAGGAFAPEELARLDAAEEFPAAACRVLDDAGLPARYVPERYGGRLTDLPALVAAVRAVARLDLTVAVAHGKTFLGAVSVWVAGPPATARWLAREVVGGTVVCWALTERDHGSDLLAGEVHGSPVDGGWRLDGTKWLINNATRSQVACVLARTSEAGGPRGFSLFLVDKRVLGAGELCHLDRIPTHGIRGADISGLSFDAAHLPATAMIGEPGRGGEIVLRALQLTRTTAVGLSLGAGDHALRLTVGFARERRVAGGRLADLPQVRDLLGRVGARLALAEAVATVVARAAHVVPGELSVLAAVAKALVPAVVQEAIDALAELLGVRGHLTEDHEHGEFARLERDHRIVALFDGSTLVNCHQLIAQFPRLARGYGETVVPADVLRGLAAGPLPALAPEALTVASASGCRLVLAVPELVDRLGDPLAAEVGSACAGVHRELAAHRAAAGMPGADVFALADRYTWCVGAAACLLLLDQSAADPVVARGALELVVERLVPDRLADDEAVAAVAERVVATPGDVSVLR